MHVPGVVSVDLAATYPRDLGVAVVRAGKRPRIQLVPPTRLGLRAPLVADELAGALADLAGSLGCHWIAVDGPCGWKQPDNGLVHSRAGDRELNAPAKPGLPGQVKPRTYTRFVELGVATFDGLARRGFARLAGAAAAAGRRTAVEIFPTACWPRLGLPRLPAKARCTGATLAACTAALASLVHFDAGAVPTHDELQATVGGLAVLRLLLGEPSSVQLAGRPPVLVDGHWREGFIVVPARPRLPRAGCSP